MDPEITNLQNQLNALVTAAMSNGSYPPARYGEITSLRDTAERMIQDFRRNQEDASKRLKDELSNYLRRIDDTIDRITRS